MRFEFRYFLITALIFALEVLIATALRGMRFVRGSLGDVFATALVFFAILTFVRVRHSRAALASFLIGSVIEFGQYVHLADLLGFKRGSVMSIALGNSFSWADIGFYGLGAWAALMVSTRIVKERFVSPASLQNTGPTI